MRYPQATLKGAETAELFFLAAVEFRCLLSEGSHLNIDRKMFSSYKTSVSHSSEQ